MTSAEEERQARASFDREFTGQRPPRPPSPAADCAASGLPEANGPAHNAGGLGDRGRWLSL
jgi:hypothetical protein